MNTYKKSKKLICSDIHGSFKALKQCLERTMFNKKDEKDEKQKILKIKKQKILKILYGPIPNVPTRKCNSFIEAMMLLTVGKYDGGISKTEVSENDDITHNIFFNDEKVLSFTQCDTVVRCAKLSKEWMKIASNIAINQFEDRKTRLENEENNNFTIE